MTTAFRFSARSLRSLEGVHPSLVRVAHRALELSPIDFVITEGRRTKERQRELVAIGASRTLNSKHLNGHALDFAALLHGQVRWDWPLYRKIGEAFKAAAKEQGVNLTWGGDWRSFKDGPHVELS